MDSDAACPPTPGPVLPGDAGSGRSGPDEENGGELAGGAAPGEQDAEEEGAVSAAAEVPRSVGECSAAGSDVPSAPGLRARASPEADRRASPAAAAHAASGGEETAHETRGEAAADLQTGSRRDAGQVRDLPAWTGVVRGRPRLLPLLRKALVRESSWGVASAPTSQIWYL